MTVHLIVGLGNPGPKYADNRHNIGFRVVDHVAQRCGCSASAYREKFKGLFAKTVLPSGHQVILLKPMTFMNLSGESVQPAMKFFNIPLGQVLCVHDELDLPFGLLRLKKGGGSAGHNGLKSLTQHSGGPAFMRLRFGIGRPRSGQAIGHVLGDFNSSERAELPDAIDLAATMLEATVQHGLEATMNTFHTAPKKS